MLISILLFVLFNSSRGDSGWIWSDENKSEIKRVHVPASFSSLIPTSRIGDFNANKNDDKASFSDIFGGLRSRSNHIVTDISDDALKAPHKRRPKKKKKPKRVRLPVIVEPLLAFSADEDDSNDLDDGIQPNSVLNVRHPDSPYGLIQEVLPNKKRPPRVRFRTPHYSVHSPLTGASVAPAEVWLSDGDLLVLKGGTTSAEDGYDNPWPPLDDYQAPYREPILAPSNILETEIGRDRFAGVTVVLPPPSDATPTTTTTIANDKNSDNAGTVISSRHNNKNEILSDFGSRSPRLVFKINSNNENQGSFTSSNNNINNNLASFTTSGINTNNNLASFNTNSNSNINDNIASFSAFHDSSASSSSSNNSPAGGSNNVASTHQNSSPSNSFASQGWVPSKFTNHGTIDTSSIPKVFPSPSPFVKFVSTQRFNRQVDNANYNSNQNRNNNANFIGLDDNNNQQPWRRVPLPTAPLLSLGQEENNNNNRIGNANNFNTGGRQNQQQQVSAGLNNDNFNFQIPNQINTVQPPIQPPLATAAVAVPQYQQQPQQPVLNQHLQQQQHVPQQHQQVVPQQQQQPVLLHQEPPVPQHQPVLHQPPQQQQVLQQQHQQPFSNHINQPIQTQTNNNNNNNNFYPPLPNPPGRIDFNFRPSFKEAGEARNNIFIDYNGLQYDAGYQQQHDQQHRQDHFDQSQNNGHSNTFSHHVEIVRTTPAPQVTVNDHNQYIITTSKTVQTSGHRVRPSLESNPDNSKITNAHAYSSNIKDKRVREDRYSYLDGLKFAKTYVLPNREDNEISNNKRRIRNKGKRKRRKNFYYYSEEVSNNSSSNSNRRRRRKERERQKRRERRRKRNRFKNRKRIRDDKYYSAR